MRCQSLAMLVKLGSHRTHTLPLPRCHLPCLTLAERVMEAISE